jgi:hypothetical protein
MVIWFVENNLLPVNTRLQSLDQFQELYAQRRDYRAKCQTTKISSKSILFIDRMIESLNQDNLVVEEFPPNTLQELLDMLKDGSPSDIVKKRNIVSFLFI